MPETQIDSTGLNLNHGVKFELLFFTSKVNTIKYLILYDWSMPIGLCRTVIYCIVLIAKQMKNAQRLHFGNTIHIYMKYNIK